MRDLNRDAMLIPAADLVRALAERNAAKNQMLAARDKRYGADRVRVFSYMENIGWPELFGYDMNRFYDDADFGLEMQLRQKIFWADNVADDGVDGAWVSASVGMYYDITLFGATVTHSPDGVPQFQPHPLAAHPDLALLPKVDFRSSGVMPHLLRYYERTCETARTRYDNVVTVNFPDFARGPLDVFVQLRGYEQFIGDILERPEFVHAALERIVTERLRWRQARREYLGLSGPIDDARVDDDWVNIPFISPDIFRDFAVPAYRLIAAYEADVSAFHTCGGMVPIVKDLLAVFPKMKALDVSAWNDFEELDRLVDPSIAFGLAMKNTFVLAGSEAQHADMLARVARVARRRNVWVCAQAIVKLHPTYEETIERVNGFVEKAHAALGSAR